MSTLSKKQRKALPVEDFGDPTRRLYPIVDQEDVDSAARLIGKAKDPEAVKKRIGAIAKRKGLDLPDAWTAKDAKMSRDADLSLTGGLDLSAVLTELDRLEARIATFNRDPEAAFKAKKGAAGEMSYGDLQQLLSTAVQAATGSTNFWIKDVYPSSVVYRDYGLSKTYRRSYAIDADNKVTLGEPEEVVERTVYETVKMAAFAMDTSGRFVDGEFAVYPNSLLFVAGEYPDKGFSMTPEEMAVAVDRFAPVSGNIEHTEFLKGRACEVRSVRLDGEDSYILRGEVAVPLWLDENLGDQERKLSCEWDRDTKELCGIGLVVNPRVSEAALMSAYQTHFAGRRHSGRDVADIQAMHDHSVKLGASCGKAAMAGRRNSKADQSRVQSIHDLTVSQGATCAPAILAKEKPMQNENGAIKAFFSEMGEKLARLMGGGATSAPTKDDGADPSATPETKPETATAEPVTGIPAELLAKFTAMESTIADLKGKLDAKDAADAAALKASIEEQAATFARELRDAGKVAPANEAAVAALFRQAAEDDRAHGVVSFGEGKQFSRVAALRAMTEALPPSAMFGQVFDETAMTKVLSSEQPKPGPSVEDQKKAFMSASPIGKAALEAVKQ